MNPQQLTFRHELKYLINRHQYFIIRQRLKNMIEPDIHVGPTGEYHIRSLYFDDMNNSALYEKQGGIASRAKYRIRIYNVEDNIILFEKKIKRNEYIAKVKEPLTRKMYESILNGDIEFLNNPSKPLLTEIYYEIKHNLLAPKVIVDYVREPYVCRNGNVRITFDKNLRTGLNAIDLFNKDLNTVSAIDDDLIILEVKFDEYIPEYIRAGIQLDGLNQQSASKYVICRKYNKENTWEDF